MAGDIIDREYLDINGMEFEVETLNQDPDDSSNVVNAMTKNNQPVGMSRGNETWEITADVAVRVSNVDNMVALDDLFSNKTDVPVTVIQEGGKAYSYEHGFVTGLGESSSHGESVKRSIAIKAWGRNSV